MVPSVIANHKSDDDLEVFSEFFAVNSLDGVNIFYNSNKDSVLANDLIVLYNKAIGYSDLEERAGKEYFTMKITEQDIAEAKIEYEAKGRSELVKSLLAVGRSIKEIAEFF